MFGFGKKQEFARRVGAREKVMKARQLNRGNQEIQSRREGEGKSGGSNAAVGLIIIFLLAVGNVILGLQEIEDITGLRGSTFGVQGADVMANIVPLLIMAAVIFLAAGILPLLTLIWVQLADKGSINVYRAFWGVSLGAPLVLLLMRDHVIPLFSEVFAIFVG